MSKKEIFVWVSLTTLFVSSVSFACTFNPVNKCEMFAFKKYFGEVEEAEARFLASHACTVVSDVSVLEYLWSKHAKKFSPAHAMDMATEERPGTLNGKLEMIQYAWSYYYSLDLDYSQAATKAAAGAARIHDLNCVVVEMRRFEPKTVKALDAAFDTCASQGR